MAHIMLIKVPKNLPAHQLNLCNQHLNSKGNLMTKTTRLSCITAAMFCLAFSNTCAAEDADAKTAQPDAAKQEDQSKPQPKEEAASQNSTPSSAPKATKEEPECN